MSLLEAFAYSVVIMVGMPVLAWVLVHAILGG